MIVIKLVVDYTREDIIRRIRSNISNNRGMPRFISVSHGIVVNNYPIQRQDVQVQQEWSQLLIAMEFPLINKQLWLPTFVHVINASAQVWRIRFHRFVFPRLFFSLTLSQIIIWLSSLYLSLFSGFCLFSSLLINPVFFSPVFSFILFCSVRVESVYSSSGVSSTGSLLLSGEDGTNLIGSTTGGCAGPDAHLGQHPFPQQTIVINGIDPFEDDPIQVSLSFLFLHWFDFQVQ